MIADTLGLNPAMQLAFAHGLFNLSNLAIQFWFIPQIEILVKKIVPGSEKNLNIRPVTLSEPIIHTSSVMAIEQAKGEIVQMGHYVISSLEAARKYYHENKEEWHDDAQQYEDAINQCDIELTEYLVKISMAELSPLESQEQAMLLEFTKDFERIGDHSMNILRYVEESIALEEKQRAKDKRNKTSTTNGRQTFLLQDEDLERLFDKVLKNVRDALQVLENDDIALAQKMLERETEINQLVELLRKKYIKLMTKGEGRAADGVLLIDISSNLERSSDRTLHIAKYIIGNKYNFKYDTSNFHYEVPEEPAETPLTNTSEVLD
jgi:phosphate:Na+ symporter